MDPYRDVAAEQRIADLVRQLKETQDMVDELHRRNKKLSKSNLEPLLEAVVNPFWWFILALVTTATVGIWKVASSSGKIDYCYVDTSGMAPGRMRVLFGHRAWRSDAQLRSMSETEDPAPLFALAKELDCPIR